METGLLAMDVCCNGVRYLPALPPCSKTSFTVQYAKGAASVWKAC